MHVSEGVLSAPVLIAGAAGAAAGTGIGLRKLDPERIPQVAVLAAAFFVASLVRVPLGPSSVHLVLNGLMGLLLGWAAFPAILVALLLQAVLFQYGGLTTLGVNAVIMALPAVAAFYAFGAGARSPRRRLPAVSSFLCGFTAVLGSNLLLAGALVTTDESFAAAAKLIIVAHLPVMIIEGLVTALCTKFIGKVRPEILEVMHGDKMPG